MANAMRGNGMDEVDLRVNSRQFHSMKHSPKAGRRSVYLAKLLQKRATVEELRTRGIIRDNAVFGCALEHQNMYSTNTSQVDCNLSPLTIMSSIVIFRFRSFSGDAFRRLKASRAT